MKTNAREIADAAIKLFAENGYRETSIGDIETAVGLTPRAGGFYRHFSKKEDVLFQAMDDYEAEILAEIEQLASLTSASHKDELSAMARMVRDHANRHRDIRNILRRDGRSIPAVKERIRRFNQADAWTVFLEWIRKKLQRRRIDDSVKLHTFQVFSTLALVLYLQDSNESPLGLDPDLVLDHWVDTSIAYLDDLVAKA